MPIAPLSLPSSAIDFYDDNSECAVGDLEYLRGVVLAAQELLDKFAADPGSDAVLKAQAVDLSAERATAVAP